MDLLTHFESHLLDKDDILKELFSYKNKWSELKNYEDMYNNKDDLKKNLLDYKIFYEKLKGASKLNYSLILDLLQDLDKSNIDPFQSLNRVFYNKSIGILKKIDKTVLNDFIVTVIDVILARVKMIKTTIEANYYVSEDLGPATSERRLAEDSVKQASEATIELAELEAEMARKEADIIMRLKNQGNTKAEAAEAAVPAVKATVAGAEARIATAKTAIDNFKTKWEVIKKKDRLNDLRFILMEAQKSLASMNEIVKQIEGQKQLVKNLEEEITKMEIEENEKKKLGPAPLMPSPNFISLNTRTKKSTKTQRNTPMTTLMTRLMTINKGGMPTRKKILKFVHYIIKKD